MRAVVECRERRPVLVPDRIPERSQFRQFVPHIRKVRRLFRSGGKYRRGIGTIAYEQDSNGPSVEPPDRQPLAGLGVVFVHRETDPSAIRLRYISWPGAVLRSHRTCVGMFS